MTAFLGSQTLVATRQVCLVPAGLPCGKGLAEVLGVRGWLRLAVATVALIVVVSAATAVADGKLPLGGGAGIIVDGTYCTLTTIGHDNTGELVGFTTAHCGGTGAQVVAEGTDTTVGIVVAAKGDIAHGELGYDVIKFDSAKVMPVANFAGFAINGIGPDPQYRQTVCEQSAATGFECGFINGPTVNPRVVNADWLTFQPGGEGAPVTADGFLVGMVRNGHIQRHHNILGVQYAENPVIKMIYLARSSMT